MNGPSEYGKAFLVGVMLGLYPVPATLRVAALITEPDPSADGTTLVDAEVPPDLDGAATDYARVDIATGPSAWTDPEPGFTTNVEPVVFTTAAADWQTVVGWALCTQSVGGEVLGFGEFALPRFVLAGQRLVIPGGALALALGGVGEEI